MPCNLSISSWSRHAAEAWRLASFLTSYAVERDRLLQTNKLPTRWAVFRDPVVEKEEPHLRAFRKVLEHARARPVTPYYSELSDILQRHIHEALLRMVTPRQALRDAQREIQAIPGFGEKPLGEKSFGEKSFGEKSLGERP